MLADYEAKAKAEVNAEQGGVSAFLQRGIIHNQHRALATAS